MHLSQFRRGSFCSDDEENGDRSVPTVLDAFESVFSPDNHSLIMIMNALLPTYVLGKQRTSGCPALMYFLDITDLRKKLSIARGNGGG